MTTKRFAVLGGSFDPAGVHHRAIAVEASGRFDEVVVVPCGPRPDKATVNDTAPIHRAIMADLAFRGIPNVTVELFDLEHRKFARAWELDAMFVPRGEVWHVVGADLVRGGKDGSSAIQRAWERGEELWTKARFAVCSRDGYPLDPGDLPPNAILIDPPRSGSSTAVRERAFRREPIDGLVSPAVAAHIERYGLYRGAPPRTTRLGIERPRALLVADDRSARASVLAERFGDLIASRAGDANCVLAIGGDGTMLRAIRDHWRLRLPFVGVNAGNRGYLMNDADELADPAFLFDDLRSTLLPLLHVEAERPDGTIEHHHAFNDAWVERSGGQSAWLEVRVDGRVRVPRLVGDGLLVATAAGSTAYARAMGAAPLLADADAWLVVGSNVRDPLGWRSAPLSFDAAIEVSGLDGAKRPIVGYVDSRPIGPVRRLSARVSRTAAAEICFAPHRDLAARLADDVFPS